MAVCAIQTNCPNLTFPSVDGSICLATGTTGATETVSPLCMEIYYDTPKKQSRFAKVILQETFLSDLETLPTETKFKAFVDNWNYDEDDLIPDKTNDNDNAYPGEHPFDLNQDNGGKSIEEGSEDEQIQPVNYFYSKDKSIQWRETAPPINITTSRKYLLYFLTDRKNFGSTCKIQEHVNCKHVNFDKER
ncbi:hypothetical protein Trydic_g11423 [Trypoxylus dichotomus]